MIRSDVLKDRRANTLNKALDLAKNCERLWGRIRGNGDRSSQAPKEAEGRRTLSWNLKIKSELVEDDE